MAKRKPSRDWDDQRYVEWRAEIRKRDNYRCKMCDARKQLQVHHIRRWKDAPSLRFSIDNGITLCKTCHKKVTKNEQMYAHTLTKLIPQSGRIDLLRKLHEENNDDDSS